ncbi:hypothetical protein D3C76_1560900 [compost metagenome]
MKCQQHVATRSVSRDFNNCTLIGSRRNVHIHRFVTDLYSYSGTFISLLQGNIQLRLHGTAGLAPRIAIRTPRSTSREKIKASPIRRAPISKKHPE